MAAALAEIRAIVRDVLCDRTIELEPLTRFDDVAGWDSMDLVTVVVEVECRFGLQFELTEIDRLSTVDDLLRMIATKQAVTAA